MRVQLISVTDDMATIACDRQPRTIPIDYLRAEAQGKNVAAPVYQWVCDEIDKAQTAIRYGRDWASPERDDDAIIAEFQQRQAADRDRRLEDEQVAQERANTAPDAKWRPIVSRELPADLKWDTLPQDQGQIVERSYGYFGNTGADPDTALYMRITDRSLPVGQAQTLYLRKGAR